MIDFQNFTFQELLQLKIELEVELKKREQEEKAAARKKILEIARTFNFDLDELFSAPKVTGGAPRRMVEPKYFNPKDPEQTWTGRGRQPVWVQEFVANGGTTDQLLINKD